MVITACCQEFKLDVSFMAFAKMAIAQQSNLCCFGQGWGFCPGDIVHGRLGGFCPGGLCPDTLSIMHFEKVQSRNRKKTINALFIKIVTVHAKCVLPIGLWKLCCDLCSVRGLHCQHQVRSFYLDLVLRQHLQFTPQITMKFLTTCLLMP